MLLRCLFKGNYLVCPKLCGIPAQPLLPGVNDAAQSQLHVPLGLPLGQLTLRDWFLSFSFSLVKDWYVVSPGFVIRSKLIQKRFFFRLMSL